MCLDDIDGFQSEGIEDEDVARGRWNVCGKGRRVRWPSLASIFSWFGQRIGDVAIFGGGREGADRGRVRGGRNDIEKGHIGNIVKVDLFLEHHRKAPAVEAHS